MARNGWNGKKWLKIAGNNLKWLEQPEKDWSWLEINRNVRNGWKRMEMAGNV